MPLWERRCTASRDHRHFLILPDFFKEILDPHRRQGRRHRLCKVLAIAAGATLCGMCGYLPITDWAKGHGKKARQRFGCRYQNKRYISPSLSIIEIRKIWTTTELNSYLNFPYVEQMSPKQLWLKDASRSTYLQEEKIRMAFLWRELRTADKTGVIRLFNKKNKVAPDLENIQNHLMRDTL